MRQLRAPAKPQTDRFSGFLGRPATRRADLERYFLARIAIAAHAFASIASPALKVLLCMFNGFAFARPFCRPIKVNLMGLG
jgi:hypothetical protein